MTLTKFSFEVPLNHLDDFHEDQDYIFTLSMLHQDPRYSDYLSRIAMEGLLSIWLDNSFNELFEAECIQKLNSIAATCNAAKVVIPDDISWSTDQMLDSLKHAQKLLPPHRLIAVAKDYDMAMSLIKQGARHMAISYWNRHTWEYDQIKRLPTPVHFLGLLDIPELLACRPNTCDTSMPIKLAMLDKDLRNWASEGYPHIHTKDLGEAGTSFFEARLTNKQIDLAKFNIETLKNAIGLGTTV